MDINFTAAHKSHDCKIHLAFTLFSLLRFLLAKRGKRLRREW